jgi:hypothetical protein
MTFIPEPGHTADLVDGRVPSGDITRKHQTNFFSTRSLSQFRFRMSCPTIEKSLWIFLQK